MPEPRTVRTACEEVRNEVHRLILWAAKEDCPRDHPFDAELSRESHIEVERRLCGLVFGLLWCIEGKENLYPDFARASFTGVSNGLTYGLIAHEDQTRTGDDGEPLRSWSIHTQRYPAVISDYLAQAF